MPNALANLSPPASLASRIDAPPAWVARFLGSGARRSADGTEIIERPDASLISITVPDAHALSPHDFEVTAADAYRRLAAVLDATPRASPVRLWNYIPGIQTPCGEDPHAGVLTRYMAFNSGRFRGYVDRFFPVDDFPAAMPTATGVGHSGTDLAIHCLALPEPGSPFENPRQTPAYAYSRRFGVRPPCFSRATAVRVGARRLLLIGGTASVLGEDSLHPGDLSAQLDETFRNLRAVIDAWDPRAQLAEVRAYIPAGTDPAKVIARVAEEWPAVRAEFLRADLCRPELMVEIEGVAGALHA